MIAADSGLPFGAIGSADSVTMFVSLRRKKSSRKTSREKQACGSSLPQFTCGNTEPKNGLCRSFGIRWYSRWCPCTSKTNCLPASAERAASASSAPSGGTSQKPPRLCLATSSQTLWSASKVVAAPQTERRKSGRVIAVRFAFSSQARRARLIASRSIAVSGAGTYSPFEHGPNLIGRPGSSADIDHCPGIPRRGRHGQRAWRELDDEGTRVTEAMVLPVRGGSVRPTQPAEGNAREPREPFSGGNAVPPRAHDPLRLVEPDRDRGSQAQDQSAGHARLSFGQRTRA